MTNKNKPNVKEIFNALSPRFKYLGDEMLMRACKHVNVVSDESGVKYETGILEPLGWISGEELRAKTLDVLELYPPAVAHELGSTLSFQADREWYSEKLDHFTQPEIVEAVVEAATRLQGKELDIFLYQQTASAEEKLELDRARPFIEDMQSKPRDGSKLHEIALYIYEKATDEKWMFGCYKMPSEFVSLELDDEERELIFENMWRFGANSTPGIRALREHYGFVLEERHLDFERNSITIRGVYNKIIDALSVRDPDDPSVKTFQEMFERYERDLGISKFIK